MESWIDGIRLRCGPLAEAATAFTAVEGLEPDPPRGVAALVALARAVDRQGARQDADEESDRDFIGLAGAFFAATLADALGSGRHLERRGRHRLALGRFGCFDPFGSIELALGAADTKRCLLEQIGEAERQAEDRDAGALVAAEVVRQLEARFARVELRHRFDGELALRVDGESLVVQLARLIALCEDEGPGVLPPAVERLLSSLPGAGLLPERAWSELAPRLYPRLLSRRFVGELPDHHDLVTRELGGGAVLALVVRFSARGRYLRRRDLDAHDETEALTTALENLAGRSASARLLHLATDHGPLVTARSGDGLDSSRLLLPGLHDILAPELGSPFLAAIPHRDALYAAPADTASARGLAARARGEAARSRYAITDRLFEVHPGGRLQPTHG